MKVCILQEAGHDLALRGMAYSFKDRALDPDIWWEGQRARALERAPKLSQKDGGHNKFLESIIVWIDIEACRAFWSEFDTYRVGTTKQSESSMHTLGKRPPTMADFEEGTSLDTMATFEDLWGEARGDVNILKMNLPDGFLQRRLVCTNYKVLRNILAQRTGHKLRWWGQFCSTVLAEAEHPEYLRFSGAV